MHTSQNQKRSEKRPPRARSSPDQGDPPSDASSVGEVYLSLYDPPALASSSDAYMEQYARTRAMLDRTGWHQATTLLKATYDACAAYVTESLRAGRGERR